MSMPAVKLLLVVTIPLSAPHPPSDAFTRSQNSVFALQQTIGGYRCGLHYFYTSLMGNLWSS
ncbi:hypothetical protein CGRA01v4_00068 [Colletotrichum graminicola]|nr:hypothetical protein CGRA01v4_00068 [Colletotrichum graminicola]